MNKNYPVYFLIIFFSSVTLLEHLEAIGTYACATEHQECSEANVPTTL